jgi:hypothetical protein
MVRKSVPVAVLSLSTVLTVAWVALLAWGAAQFYELLH